MKQAANQSSNAQSGIAPWLPLLRCLAVAIALTITDGCSRLQTVVWQERVQNDDLSTREFTQIVADAIHEAEPKLKIKVVAPLEIELQSDDSTSTCYLNNAWNEFSNDPDHRFEVVSRHVDVVRSSLAFMLERPAPDLANVVPLIKSTAWLENASQQGMQVFHEPLAADLHVVYAEEGEHQLAYVRPDQTEAFGLKPSELRNRALENLAQRIPQVKRHGEGPLYMMAAGGTFEASLLLVDSVWDEQDGAVDGRLVVAVPTREILMFTGERATESIQHMRRTTDSFYANGSYLIGKTLLVRDEGKWIPFD